MICDQTDGYVIQCICLVSFMRHLTYFVTDCFHSIDIKYRIYVLHNNSQTFQSHTCINVFIFQFFVISFSITVKLCKYVVPYFHKTVTVTAYFTIRAATAVFFSTVIVNLRTWTTRTRTMLPEVITLTILITIETCNSLCRYTDLFCPDFKCFLILTVNRRIQTLRIQFQHFGQELPGPGNCLMFEIITKRKVSQHLKEGQMTCCLSYILNITGTDTFLTCGNSALRWNLCSCKIRF